MVLTRRQTATKVTFPEEEDDETSINLQAEEGSEESEQEQPKEDESDSDSDSDEAPEEESTGAAKSEILEKEKQRKELEQEKKRIEREKRRQQDAYNQQQQQLKRENEEKARAKESQQQQQQQDNLPELLPSDIIEAANNTSLSKDKNITGKHTILEDMDLTMKKQIKLERLKQLKRLNKPEVKKGPVLVKVLNTHNKNKVPKSESKIIGAKDKWLKRKSLNKK